MATKKKACKGEKGEGKMHERKESKRERMREGEGKRRK